MSKIIIQGLKGKILLDGLSTKPSTGNKVVIQGLKGKIMLGGFSPKAAIPPAPVPGSGTGDKIVIQGLRTNKYITQGYGFLTAPIIPPPGNNDVIAVNIDITFSVKNGRGIVLSTRLNKFQTISRGTTESVADINATFPNEFHDLHVYKQINGD